MYLLISVMYYSKLEKKIYNMYFDMYLAYCPEIMFIMKSYEKKKTTNASGETFILHTFFHYNQFQHN